MRFTLYEYFSGTEKVEIDIPDEEISKIAEECKAEGKDREYFMECVKDFIGDNKWEYETDRYDYGDRSYDDWDWDDDFRDSLDEIEDAYYDCFNSSVRPVGEFGND